MQIMVLGGKRITFFFCLFCPGRVSGSQTMKITQYKMVVGTKEDVELDVNKLIKDGWQPLGAPAVCSQDRPYELCQAMVRVEVEPGR